MNPGKIVNAPPMTESLRDVALPGAFAARHPALVRQPPVACAVRPIDA